MIQVESLYKEYDSLIAVDDINLKINENSVFALIGPNGAGKTTFLRMLATLIKPTKGSIIINGFDSLTCKDNVRKKIGFLPDFFYLYEDLKVFEYLEYFCDCYLIPKLSQKKIIDEAIEIVNLTSKKNDFISGLSRGMKQRVGIAKTILHSPEIILFDEPASGLDPKARIELRSLIKKLKKMGKTILVSSHILTELADFCDSFALIEKGKLIKSGAVNEISAENKLRSIELKVVFDLEKAFTLIKGLSNVQSVFVKNKTIYFSFEGTLENLSEINTYLIKQGIKIFSFYEKQKNIEDLFMQYSSNEVN